MPNPSSPSQPTPIFSPIPTHIPLIPTLILLLILGLLPFTHTHAHAHRLDECLQAVRFDIQKKGVRIELDITPGVEVLPHWLSSADVNQDGDLDLVEVNAYAELVKSSLQLSINGQPWALHLVDATAPTRGALQEGNGKVRLIYTAHAPRGRWKRGTHTLHWINNHFTPHSVHLSNALIPSHRSIQIIQQQRDETQRDYTLTFRR